MPEIVAFLIVSLETIGFTTTFLPEDSCAEALHEMRVEHRLTVESMESFHPSNGTGLQIAYTLRGGLFHPNRSAVLVCEPQIENLPG
jgi:hypothetical protein